jgi:hypothetical protein
MTMQAPAAAVPFPLGTRRIIERIFSGAFAPGGAQIAVELGKVGYLAGLIVRLSGTYTVVTASPGPKATFPYDYVQRFQLDLPGLNDPVSISGSQLKYQGLAGRDLTLFGQGGGISAMFDTDQMSGTFMKNADFLVVAADVYPVAVAVNTWNLTWYLPVAHNARDWRGCVPLGNSQTAVLRVTPGADADLVATPANHSASALTLDVFQVYFTAPPAGVATPDTTWAVVFDQYEQNVVASGDQVVDIPRDGVLLNVMHCFRNVDTAYPIASTLAAQLQAVSFRVARDKLLDGVPLAVKLIEQNAGRTIPYPAGLIVYDFDARQDDIPFMDAGGERIPGWVFSDGIPEIKSTLTVPSGATLTNAKIVTTVKRLMKV